MSVSVQHSLFNPTLGIEALMPGPEEAGLPRTHELATSALTGSSLEALYGPVNTRTAFEAMLCPGLGDGRLVAPERFRSEMEALTKKLKQSRKPELQAFLKDEIEPLLINGQLLNAYRNLMVGG